MTNRARNPEQNVASQHQVIRDFIPSSERRALGKALRDVVPRKSHAGWSPSAERRDVISVLKESNRGRVAELIPIRYGRMLNSPFTFFRGSAALMAMDLSSTPVSGLKVQLCGDCHLLNFGAFATPERNMILDINDFDETTPGPWEWDLMRLTTSFVLACRGNGFGPDTCREVAEFVARAYRNSMRDFSEMTALEVWYSKLDVDTYISSMKDKEMKKTAAEILEKRKNRSIVEYYFPKMTVEKDGRHVFRDVPPLVYHTDEQRELEYLDLAQDVFEDYKATLGDARRFLLHRYTLVDVAMKVVGIGSVGTLCGVLLLMADENDPLILQVKEARQSVLEPYLNKGAYQRQGQRVVEGQRLMQSQSDIFLGWAKSSKGHDFYFRQLKDMKIAITPEVWTPGRAFEVAESLGWVLARAHARSGDSTSISGYLGLKDVFDKATADFAVAYADQTERDYKTLVAAVRKGKVEAIVER